MDYISPIGKIPFDKAYEIYSEAASGLDKADIIFVSTMADTKMAKAAFLAAKDNTNLPIFVNMTYIGGRTPTGTDPLTTTTVFQSMGATGIGTMCGTGPDGVLPIAKTLVKSTTLPLALQPNAGVPKIVDGKSVIDTSPETMAEYSKKFAELGANLIGSCCGSGPEHTKEIAKAVKGIPPKARDIKPASRLSGRTVTIELDKPLMLGERINPTSKEVLTRNIKHGETSEIIREALQQVSAGAGILDINVGVAGVDEKKALLRAMNAVSAITDVPLSLDTKDVDALEACLREAPGKFLINSVTGEEKSLETVLPLAKRYGAAIIGLTVDDAGVGKTAEQKVKIAKKIIERAEKEGISKEDIIIDTVTLSIATDPKNAEETLNALKEIKRMGYKTILGVSNISHGLSKRSEVNSHFLHQALESGLDIAIINPLDKQIIGTFNGELKSTGIDLSEYVKIKLDYVKADTIEGKLRNAILYGQEDAIVGLVESALRTKKVTEVNFILLTALNKLDEKFEKKEIFLPQLLLSASTMKKAIERLKREYTSVPLNRGKIIMATVKGDLHDIGKNIVITLLESNGFTVVDAGTDVPPKMLLALVKDEKPDMIGLSALMTTTATEMETTIKFLRENGVTAPILVGGAVLDEGFAESIGGIYCHDGMVAVKTVKKVLDDNN